MEHKNLSIRERIQRIADEFGCSYEQIKLIVYSNVGKDIKTEDEKLKYLEKRLNIDTDYKIKHNMRCHIHIKDTLYKIDADIKRIKCIVWWENPLTGNIQRSEGIARCAPEDKYDETLGKRIAEGRAKIKMWATFTENAIYVRQRIKCRNDKFITHEINHINNLIYNFDKPNM